MQIGAPRQKAATRLRWRQLAACATMLTALAPWTAAAAEVSATPPPASPTVDTLTNPIQVWPLSTEMKSVAHRIRFEGRVSFYDPRWHNSWLETDGVGTYVKLSPSPPLLRSGQRVRIEGTMVPLKGLADDTVKVTVLQDYEPIEPLATKGRIREKSRSKNRRFWKKGAQIPEDAFFCPRFFCL